MLRRIQRAMASALFTHALLSLGGRHIELTPLRGAPEGTFQFAIAADDAAFLQPLRGQLGVAQTKRGVVLMRLRVLEVDLPARILTAVASDRHRESRVPAAMCAVGRLSGHRRR